MRPQTFPRLGTAFLSLFLAIPTVGGAAKIVPVASDDGAARVGTGYDAGSGLAFPSCVQGATVRRGQKLSNVEWSESLTESDLMEEMHGSGRMTVDAGWLGSVTGKAEFAARHGANSTTENFVFLHTMERHDDVIVLPEPNARGVAAASLAPGPRFDQCGSGFVSSVGLGARFVLVITLQARSEESFRKLKVKVKAKALGGLVKKKKTIVDEETAKEVGGAIVRVSAEQVGGDEAAFRAMLGGVTEIACDLSNLDSCADRAAALQEYAETSWVNQFPEGDDSRFRPLSMEITRYDEIHALRGLAQEKGFVAPRKTSFTQARAANQVNLWERARIETLVLLGGTPGVDLRALLKQRDAQVTSFEKLGKTCDGSPGAAACIKALDGFLAAQRKLTPLPGS